MCLRGSEWLGKRETSRLSSQKTKVCRLILSYPVCFINKNRLDLHLLHKVGGCLAQDSDSLPQGFITDGEEDLNTPGQQDHNSQSRIRKALLDQAKCLSSPASDASGKQELKAGPYFAPASLLQVMF